MARYQSLNSLFPARNAGPPPFFNGPVHGSYGTSVPPPSLRPKEIVHLLGVPGLARRSSSRGNAYAHGHDGVQSLRSNVVITSAIDRRHRLTALPSRNATVT